MLHAVHVPPSGPLYPALHLQAVLATLAGTEKLFDRQVSQPELPDSLLYSPGAQGQQVAPFMPVYPATHEQFVIIVLPLSEVLLGPHPEHPMFPIAFLYVPIAQAPHADPDQPNPAAHEQLLGLIEPRNSVVVGPAQSVHALLLTSLLNLPTGHVSQVYALLM